MKVVLALITDKIQLTIGVDSGSICFCPSRISKFFWKFRLLFQTQGQSGISDYLKECEKWDFLRIFLLRMAKAASPKTFCIMYVSLLHTANCLIGKSARSYDFLKLKIKAIYSSTRTFCSHLALAEAVLSINALFLGAMSSDKTLCVYAIIVDYGYKSGYSPLLLGQ
ncbi:hypothetical protein [Calothrix sp. PCC 7507]|uniref:hypothetical protein n=1 Tax=Calothrix sp. PCC 7507 TaxID=99598 RepID=UPI00029EE5F6|nr:hypothetical protein [Calothrix sp. PCC 7507]AFY32145.1 hypothetical protein Cal7507_1688 [Calothrix sp. PCC 7507]